jgi:hypothetical protein
VGLEQAATVGVGDVDGMRGDGHAMRAEVQALPRDHPEPGRVDLDQPAGVVGDPDRTAAEGDALRASWDARRSAR